MLYILYKLYLFDKRIIHISKSYVKYWSETRNFIENVLYSTVFKISSLDYNFYSDFDKDVIFIRTNIYKTINAVLLFSIVPIYETV